MCAPVIYIHKSNGLIANVTCLYPFDETYICIIIIFTAYLSKNKKWSV